MKNKALEICNNPQEIAFLSVDNTRGFEDKALKELYVAEGELAAVATKKAIEICKDYGISIINVFDNHPEWHVLFAENYKNKKPYDTISYDEVKQRTLENNGIGDRATFSLRDLQRYLSKVGQETLRPDHSIEWTSGVELMQPLEKSDFDFHIPKGTDPLSSGYSGFDETILDQTLRQQKKKILLIGGVATDYCDWQTALEGKYLGYEPYLIKEAIKGVAPETTKKMLKELSRNNIEVITLSELATILSKNFNQ